MAPAAPAPTALAYPGASILPADMPQEIQIEHHPQNGQLLGEHQGLALFSTNGRQRPKRDNYLGQPRQIRSDRQDAIVTMAAALREKFPEHSISIHMKDNKDPLFTQKYFDNFDIHYYSPLFLFDLLTYIATTNAASRAERVADVEKLARWWIDAYPEAFSLFEADHQWFHLFPAEHHFVEQYGFPMLYDAWWRIAEIKEERTNAETPRYLQPTATGVRPVLNEATNQYKPTSSEIIVPPTRPRRVSGPQSLQRDAVPRAPYQTSSSSLTATGYGTIPTRMSSRSPLSPVPGPVAPTQGNQSQRFVTNPYPSAFGSGHSPVFAQVPGVSSVALPGPIYEYRWGQPTRETYYLPRRSTHNLSDSICETDGPLYGQPRVINKALRQPDRRLSSGYSKYLPSSSSKTYRNNQNRRSSTSDSGTSMGYLPPQRPNRNASFSQGAGHFQGYDSSGIENIRNVDYAQRSLAVAPRMPTHPQNTVITRPDPYHMANIVEERGRTAYSSGRFAPSQVNNMLKNGTEEAQQRQKKWNSKISPSKSLRLQIPGDTLRHGQDGEDAHTSRHKLWLGSLPPDMQREELNSLLKGLKGFRHVTEPRVSKTQEGRYNWVFADFENEACRDLALPKFKEVGALGGYSITASLPIPRNTYKSNNRPTQDRPYYNIESYQQSSTDAALVIEETKTTQHLPKEQVQDSTTISQGTKQAQSNDKGSSAPVEVDKAASHLANGLEKERNIAGHPKVPDYITNVPETLEDADPAADASSSGKATTQNSAGDVQPIYPTNLTAQKVKSKKSAKRARNKPSKEGSPQPKPKGEATDLNGTMKVSEESASKDKAKHVDLAADFPPLSQAAKVSQKVKEGKSDATPATAPLKSESISKSFAQIASQHKEAKAPILAEKTETPQPQGKKSSEAAQPMATQDVDYNNPTTEKLEKAPNAALQKTKDPSKPIDEPKSDLKETESTEKKEISPSQTVTPKRTASGSTPVRPVVPLEKHSAASSKATTSAMDRDVGSSMDTVKSSSPSRGVPTAPTTFAQSPNDNVGQNQSSSIPAEAIPHADTGINADVLRSRLENATCPVKPEKMAATDVRSDSVIDPTAKRHSPRSPDESSVKVLEPIDSIIESMPPQTPPKGPERLEDRETNSADHGTPVSSAAAGPISTHKKKNRSRLVTPVKKSFSAAEKADEVSANPSSPVTSPSEAIVKSNYPSVTKNLVTVLSHSEMSALQRTSGTDIIEEGRSATEQDDEQKKPNLRQTDQAVSQQSEALLLCQRKERVESCSEQMSLAQRVARSTTWTTIKETMSIGDFRVQKHIPTTLRMVYKLQKVKLLTHDHPETANHALKLLKECPLQQVKNLHQAVNLRAIVNWNVTNMDWIDQLPANIVFDKEMSQDIFEHTKILENRLSKFWEFWSWAHQRGINPVLISSSNLFDAAWDLLKDGPHPIRTNKRYTNVQQNEELITWIINALCFIDQRKEEKLWPEDGFLPADVRLQDNPSVKAPISQQPYDSSYPILMILPLNRSMRAQESGTRNNKHVPTTSLDANDPIESQLKQIVLTAKGEQLDEASELKRRIAVDYARAARQADQAKASVKPKTDAQPVAVAAAEQAETKSKSKKKRKASKKCNDLSTVAQYKGVQSGESSSIQQLEGQNTGNSSSDETLKNSPPQKFKSSPAALVETEAHNEQQELGTLNEFIKKWAAENEEAIEPNASYLEAVARLGRVIGASTIQEHRDQLNAIVEKLHNAKTRAEYALIEKDIPSVLSKIPGFEMPEKEALPEYGAALLGTPDPPPTMNTMLETMAQAQGTTMSEVSHETMVSWKGAILTNLVDNGYELSENMDIVWRPVNHQYQEKNIDDFIYSSSKTKQQEKVKDSNPALQPWDPECIEKWTVWGIVNKDKVGEMIKARVEADRKYEEVIQKWQDDLLKRHSGEVVPDTSTLTADMLQPSAGNAAGKGKAGTRDVWRVPSGEAVWGAGAGGGGGGGSAEKAGSATGNAGEKGENSGSTNVKAPKKGKGKGKKGKVGNEWFSKRTGARGKLGGKGLARDGE